MQGKPLTFVLDGVMLDAISFISAVLGASYARSTPEGTFWWTASDGTLAVVLHKHPHLLEFTLEISLDDLQGGFQDLVKRYAILGYAQQHGMTWSKLNST